MSKWGESNWSERSWGPFESKRDQYERELREEYPDLEEAFNEYIKVYMESIALDRIGIETTIQRYEDKYMFLLKLYWDHEVVPF